MIVIAGLVLGAAFGAWTAKKHGGRLPDMLQYAAGYGMALGLVGVIATIVLERVLS